MKLNPLTKYLLFYLYQALLSVPKIGRERDGDPLHQFRVSLRRIRSLLKLYLPEEPIFPKILKTFIKSTNPLRELDVFLLSLDTKTYKRTFKLLTKMQKERYESLFAPQVKKELNQTLEIFYDRLTELNPAIDTDTLIASAHAHYRESYRRYRELSPHASAEEFHALRIRFKTSRYALEFLRESSLDNENDTIETCKQLQNRLGEIQDLSNQIEWLRNLRKEDPLGEFDLLLPVLEKKLKKLKAANR